jgi:hypothetical protein
MKLSILVLLFFSLTSVTAQNKKIKQSDLVGYWKHGHIITKDEYRVKVYTRVEKDSKNALSLLHFKSDGKYSIIFIRKPQKCGNHIYPKNINGTFKLDYEKQEIDLSNNINDKIELWNIVWIDENSFGKIIP